MKTYIVPLDIAVLATDQLDGLDRARQTIGNAMDALDETRRGEDALVLQGAEYGEPYPLDPTAPESITDDGAICIYDDGSSGSGTAGV